MNRIWKHLAAATIALAVTACIACQASYDMLVVADAPAQYLRLGDASGTTAIDVMGNVNGTYTGNGITLGEPSLIDGASNTACALAGTNDYVNCGNAVPSNAAFSVEVWYIATDNTNRSFVTKGDGSLGGVSNRDVDLFQNATGELKVIFSDGTNYLLNLGSGVSPAAGVRHHVVLTWDGTTNANGVRMYLDGAEVATGTLPAIPSNTHPWCCGGRGNDFTLAGTVDEFALYDHVLSAAAVSAHYNAAVSSEQVVVTSPLAYQTFQRDGSGNATVTVSGSYTGTPTAIEARFNGGAWQTIDPAPAGGSFSGPLTIAGQGTLDVRFVNQANVAFATQQVGVGDVFVVIGQSNAHARLSANQAWSHPTLTATMFRSGFWSSMVDPTGNDGGGGSPYPLIATQVMAQEGVPVAVINTAVGSTGLVVDGHWKQGGPNYNACVQAVQSAGVNGIKAFLWFQGENDAVDQVSSAAYESELSLMLDDLQADLGTTAPLLCANIGENPVATPSAIDEIRKGIIAAINNDQDILPGPFSHDQDFPDNTHWLNATQATELGSRWSRCVLSLYGGTDDPRGPRFSSATFSGSVAVVNLTGGVQPLVNGNDSTGWQVSDGAGPRSIISATAVGNSVQLTCDQVMTAPVTVSYAVGLSAIGTTTHDSGGMPIEPIYSQPATAGMPQGLVVDVTPDDNADLPGGIPSLLYVGGSGTLEAHDANGVAFSLPAVVGGHVYSIPIRRVLTSTTATDLKAIYSP